MNIKKIILIISLATNIHTQAYRHTDTDNYYTGNTKPLYEGACSLQIEGNIAPITWYHRSEIDLVSCASNDANPIFALTNELPPFTRLFHMPWIIGGKVGYNLTDNIEIYGECNYLQAQHKNACSAHFPILHVADQSLNFNFHTYALIDAYAGGRYYWNRWFNRVAFFAGGQIGLTAHRNTQADVTLNDTPAILLPTINVTTCPRTHTTCPNNTFFRKNTVVSGGLNLGLDICFCSNWSLVITGEIIASGGPKSRTVSMFETLLPAPTLSTNLIVGNFGTELRIPITVGIRHTF